MCVLLVLARLGLELENLRSGNLLVSNHERQTTVHRLLSSFSLYT